MATWIPGRAASVTWIQARAHTAATRGGVNAVVRLSNGTITQDLTLVSTANDTGPVALAYSVGSNGTLSFPVAAVAVRPLRPMSAAWCSSACSSRHRGARRGLGTAQNIKLARTAQNPGDATPCR